MVPYRVLIIDDEKFVRASIRNRIDWPKLNIEVVAEAENGEQALEQLRKLQPDIALVDICMPGMDGFELIRRAREILPELHVLVLSGYSDYAHLRKGLHLRVDDYLCKPIDLQEFTRCVSKITNVQIPGEPPADADIPAEHTMDARICAYIRRHYAQKLTLAGIANEFFISSVYLSIYFKQSTGQNLFDYIRDVRVEQAKILLRSSEKSVTEIALDVGYPDMAYFAHVFKKAVGTTPLAYRRRGKESGRH